MYNDYLTLTVHDLKVREDSRRAESKVIPFDTYAPEPVLAIASESCKPARPKRLLLLRFRPTSA